MVKKDAIVGVHAVTLAVIQGRPVGKDLGHPVWAARPEGGGLALRNLLHLAVISLLEA